jgi:hypothetical protein
VRGLIATSIIYYVILCGGQRYTRLNKKETMKKIRSWSLAVEWEHSDKTWSTELLGQGDMDKLTFKNIEKYLKNHAKIENQTEE